MSSAMNYETLIRNAHNCGRYGVTGANADIFRGLESASVRYEEEKNHRLLTQEELDGLLADYMYRCGEISAYIIMAIDTIEKEKKDSLSQNQRDEFNEIRGLLRTLTIAAIDESIERASTIMEELKN